MVEILPPKYTREYLAFTRPDKVTGLWCKRGQPVAMLVS